MPPELFDSPLAPECPHCHSPVPILPGIEMQAIPVLCDLCLDVSIYDNGRLRLMTYPERVEFNGSPMGELVRGVRDNLRGAKG